jgi:hypothetical protein
MRKFFLFVLPAMALLTGMTACNRDNRPDPSADGKARYTIMVYGNAGGSMDNVIECLWERAKPLMKNNEVRLGFFYKYGKKAKESPQKYADPGNLLFFELTDKTNLDSLRYTSTTSGWEDFELYDPQLLQLTIDMMTDSMPAQNYILLIWGHGGGFDPSADYPKDLRNGKNKAPAAVVYDEWLPVDGHGGEGMSMYELGEAVSKSKIKHLKALFFHNCFIGNMETIDEIYDKADYIFSSMHALYSDGRVVESLINALYAENDFEKAGKAALGGMTDSDEGCKEENSNGDFNFFKTSEFPGLEPLFQRLAKRLVELYPTQKQAIDLAFDRTYKVNSRYAFYDALDYANRLAAETNDAEIKAVAADLKKAFDKIWIYRRSFPYQPQAPLSEFTLSVYMIDKEKYAQNVGSFQYTYRDAYEYLRFHKRTGWGNWINTNTHIPQGNPTGQIME